jgi:outer membrane immunogenic protein
MMRFLLVLFALAVGMAAPSAAAADLDDAAPPGIAVPMPAGLPTWSGFYLGAGLGGRWTDAEWTTTALGENETATAPFATSNPAGFDLSGTRISAYLGHNWQIGHWVLGVEADLGWGDNGRRRVGIPGTLPVIGPGLADTGSVEDQWDTSVRARFGYLATPDLLVYATGGASWTRREVSASCAGPLAPVSLCPSVFFPGIGVIGNRTESASDILAGWTVGGGLEWKVAPGWMLRGEYRYSEYESTDFAFFGTTGVNAEQFRFSVDQQTHTAYLGLSYLFPAAAVASASAPGATRAPVPKRDFGYDWTGFNLGPQIGGAWTATELIDFTGTLAPPNLPGSVFRVDADGFIAGGQLGFNYQAGAWVLGIEAQGAWADVTGSIRPANFPPPFDMSIRLSSNIDWLATVTGRVGLALGNSLPYVKGGWALAGESYSGDVTVLGASIPVTPSDRMRSGWVIGAGVEWAIAGQWTARLEYSFMDFGTETRSITAAGAPPTPFDVDLEVHSFTFGVNYRFGPAPIAGRF